MRLAHERKQQEDFMTLLEWAIRVCRRYPNALNFGLAHVSMGETQEIGNALGVQEANRQLNEVVETLRSAFRKTDLVMRDGVDFWILAPYTPADENITEKIHTIIKEVSQQGLDIMDRNIAVFSIPMQEPNKVDTSSAHAFLRSVKALCEAKACDELCQGQPCQKIAIKAVSVA